MDGFSHPGRHPSPLPRRISLPAGPLAVRGSWLGWSSADAPEARRRDESGRWPAHRVVTGKRPDETAASLTASSVRFREGFLTFLRLDISRLPALAPVADRRSHYVEVPAEHRRAAGGDGAQDGALVAGERVLASVGGPVGTDDVGDVEGGTGGRRAMGAARGVRHRGLPHGLVS